MRHVTITLSGKVQGVVMRASAQAQAQMLGLTGWVRNNADGTVTLVVEGEETAVSRFIAWVKVGPRHARIDDVHVTEGEWENYSQFNIR
jgi:acylphosphatase